MKFELNEAMLREMEGERRRAQTIARAEAEMIVNMFMTDGGDRAAALGTAVVIEKTCRRRRPQLRAAISRFLLAVHDKDWEGARREYCALLEQLMEHNLDMAQQPARKRKERKQR